MCLHSKLIENRKYTATKKNGGIVPPLPLINFNGKMIPDERVKWVPVPCGKCMECTKKKSREWSIRLQEEIKTEENGIFVTLTFSDESIAEISKDINGLKGYDLDNEIATIATRRFLERWRKKYKKSVRHWLVTELGHNGTENIHMHGFIWVNNMNKKDARNEIEKIWKYGWIYPQEKDLSKNYVSERTINYSVKYINKIDEKHKEYKPKVLTSAGIGSNYLKRSDAEKNKYAGKGKTREYYKTKQGKKVGLTTYYRNNIYTEQEKEKLWQEKLDSNTRYIAGEKVDVSKNDKTYNKLLRYYQNKNRELGYGNEEKNWERKRYEESQRNLRHKQRVWKAERTKAIQEDTIKRNNEEKEIRKNRYNRAKAKLKLKDIEWTTSGTSSPEKGGILPLGGQKG